MRVKLLNIVSTYERIGYLPNKFGWVNISKRTCCPLSAIILAAGKIPHGIYEKKMNALGHWESIVFLAGLLGASPSYVLGFSVSYNGIDQADALDKYPEIDLEIEAFSYGYTDGLSASIICRDKI